MTDLMRVAIKNQRYRLKKRYFNGVPANQIRTTSPVRYMIDVEWRALVFLNENRGATPPGNRKHILTEETNVKIQRGGTYALPNQRLGNEGRRGQAKIGTTAKTASEQHYKRS
jgi:hypothetical protein